MTSFLARWPGWALGLVAVVALGAIGTLGVFALKAPHVSVATSVKPCLNQPPRLASLFSDSQTTMIRLSNPDFSDMRILRTEPANVLPGMFEALLSLSQDGSRLAYVTAADELMDDAHIDYIDVANPGQRLDLASISSGFWVVKPGWSPDHTRLAWVQLNLTSKPEQFELWMADTSTQPATVSFQADLNSDLFTNGQSASICWTAGDRVVLLPNTQTVLPSPSPTPGQPSPSASPSPVTGSPCGVPIFSQNDPAWRDTIMQAGADSIGGKGCAITSAAMLLNYYGATLTPGQLSTCLGNGADPVAWKSVPTCTKSLITGGDRLDFTWPDLDNILGSGRPAIVGMLRGLTGSHFVVVTSGGGDIGQNYRITDPWDATTFKTLASYIDAGYVPKWIITYSGAGRNCARLITGLSLGLTGIQDGGTTKNPVTVNIAPNLSLTNIKSLGIIKLSSGTIQPNTYNLPLTYTKLAPGTVVSDEGIYQVKLITKAPSQPPVMTFYSFTIDHTPPAVDLALLNLLKPASSMMHAGVSAPGSIAASSYPLIDKPGKVQVVSSDTLSGLAEIKYSLDGAALAEYTDDMSFNRVLTVPQPGDHSLRIQSFDAAGNMKEVTKFFTVFGYVPPPSPTPPPPPPSCPTTLKLIYFHTGPFNGNGIPVGWGSNGGCANFTGSITAVASTTAIPTRAWPLSAQNGSFTDSPGCLAGIPPYTETYSLVIRDSFGQTVTNTAAPVPCP